MSTSAHFRGTFARLLVAMVAAAVLATVLPSAASAQTLPQHELLIGIDFDGTPDFSPSDPFDDGIGGHTPGLDLNANNNVVRTNDQIQYALNWNVNEADATDVTIKVTLPEKVTWLPDATTATGVPGGCTDDGTSSITGNGGRDLVCVIANPQIEGSNGAIHARVLVGALLNNDVLNVSGTIESNENTTPATSNTLTTTVSATPRGDWVKGEPLVDAVSGDIISYQPDEIYYDVPGPGDAPGRLFIWNLRLLPTGGLKGAEPMNDTVDIQFWDHFFDTVPSTQLADPAMMPLNNLGMARVPCGGYDGDGAYPYGQTLGVASTTPVDQTNIGQWSCTDLAAPNGYPLIQIDISGQDTQNIAAKNADLAPNSDDVLASGQIAFWAAEADLVAKPGVPQIVQNAITGSTSALPLGTVEVDPIPIVGTTAAVDENVADSPSGGNAGLSNNAPYEFPSSPPSDPGRAFRHAVVYLNGPYSEIEYQDFGGKTYRWYDHRSVAKGGPGAFVTNGDTVDDSTSHYWWRGDGQTPRGNVLTVLANIGTNYSREPANGISEPIHQCVAIDTTHQEIIGLPPTFDVTLGDLRPSNAATNTRYLDRATIGGYTATPSSPIANVIAGLEGKTTNYNFHLMGGVVVDRGAPTYTLEFASGSAVGNKLDVHGATCNEGDADGRGWVDGETGNLAVFATGTAPDGSTLYGDINRVRIRTEGNVPWHGNNDGTVNATYGTALMTAFQVRVKDNPAVGFQEAGQELIVYSSRARGEWDGTGEPPTSGCTHSAVFNDPLKSGVTDGETNIDAGWCNLPFADDGMTSTTTTDLFNEFDGRAIEFVDNFGRERLAHADKIFIVEAALAISKSNTAGASEIVTNGNITEFEVNPRVVGSSLDEIDNVVVKDPLPSTMAFMGFTHEPDPADGSCSHSGGSPAVSPIDPTQTVTVGGTITCTYGDDLTGGWGTAEEGMFAFEVMIVGAEADSTLKNTATVTGVDPFDPDIDKSPASSSASVFTGAPFDESVIVKAIDTGVGDCTEYPSGPIDAPVLDPEPADWADRCEMIEFEDAPASATTTMGFTLEMANQGNTPLTGVRFVDVFPHRGDEVEPISNTGADGVPVPTIGDGRTPETDYAVGATLAFDGLVGDHSGYWVSGDAAGSISRDPDYSLANTTWCNAAGGTVQNGVGIDADCPAAAADITAVYVFMDDIPVGEKITTLLTLESTDHECDDIWTNTFGARIDQIALPIRSNDVSIMVDCHFDLALRKTIDPTWAPGPGWLTPGTSTVDFVIEVHNQGDPVNNIDVTDYVDPSMFTFDLADNAPGTTGGDLALPFTWDDSGPNPVVAINDQTEATHDPSSTLITNTTVLEIPVTLTIASGYVPSGDLDNKAEISYFDNDADASNGDTDSGDLVDDDSTIDDTDGDTLIDDEIDEDILDGGTDEDDHDIASIPVWDLEIDKKNPTMTQVTPGAFHATYDIEVTNASNQTAYSIGVLETPPTGLAYNSSNAATVTVTDGTGAAVVISDANPNYTIDTLAAGDSVTFTVTYDVTDVTAGPYVNSVQIDSFDDDTDPDNDLLATTVDADSTPDNDSDHTQSNEDDDDVESINVPFDLALVKKLDVADPAYPDILDGIQDGDLIKFNIEVFNQLAQVEDFDVIDYVSAGWIFNPANQPAVLVTAAGSLGGPALPFTWDNSGANPISIVDGVLPSGQSVLIPVVLEVDLANAVGDLENEAEIMRFDDDGNPSNGDSADGTHTDLDSAPDDTQGNDPIVDDEFNDDGTIDQDDHDLASTKWYDVAIEKGIWDGAACTDGPLAITAATLTVEYCLTVTNQGPNPLHLVSFADTPPAGLTFSSTTSINAANVTDNTGGAYTITLLPVDGSETVRLDYTLDLATATASMVNVAEVTEMFADAGGTDPAEDVDSYVDPTADGDLPTEDDESAEEITIPHDLAFTKTLGAIDGDEVTMYLTVTNQSIGVETIDITDYIDPSMWQPFNPTLNAPGAVDPSSTATAAFGFSWNDDDPVNPVATIAPTVAGDKLTIAETIVIPIVLTISDTWVGPALSNTAEISNFDDDGDPANGDAADGSLIDADSTPDATNGNGPGESDTMTDDDIDGDPAAGGDEDDHDGVLVPIYDLALVKTLDPATTQPLSPGQEVTFLIEIINQGNTYAQDPTVIDYVDQTMFGPFDALLGDNLSGTTTGDALLPYAWAASGTDGALTVTGLLPPGDSIIVPVTLRISFAPTATVLNNTAEITGGTATDGLGAEITDGDDNPLTDRDSTPDTENDDTLVDDVTDNTGGDQDDHDIAEIIVALPAIDIEKATNGVQSDMPLGEQIMAGEDVTWTYVVTNSGNTALLDAVVGDSDPSLGVDCGGGSDTIALLLPGQMVTCTAMAPATAGPYSNTGTVTGTPAWPTDPALDPTDPAAWPTDPSAFAPTGQDPVDDTDKSHYFGTDGGLMLEKSTNGIDADVEPGVALEIGDAVVWTYEVTNTSPVAMLAVTVNDSDIGAAIDCGDGTNVVAILAPGAVVTCTSIALASAVAGQYRNDSDVAGTGALPTDIPTAAGDPADWPTDLADYTPTIAPTYTDDDPSHYFALEGGIAIEKSTNDADSDVAPGNQILAGEAVTWTYVVMNTSNAVMIDVTVNDDDPTVAVDCGDGTNVVAAIPIGGQSTCTAQGTAITGAYDNVGDVVGTPAIADPANPGSYVPTGHDPLTDDDPSNYFGAEPSVVIEKSTNGEDADDTVGPVVAPGAPVIWTYEVTNDGNVPLTNVTVNDNDPTVFVVCELGTNFIALLLPGASYTCEAEGIAQLGAYENIADVVGTPAELSDPTLDPSDPDSYQDSGLAPVTDDDPSHYIAHDGEIMIMKYTNGEDANSVPGPAVATGEPVVWTYVITNTSSVALSDVEVSDDQGEAVDCGDGTNTIAALLPGESHQCTATNIAVEGQYGNIGSVTGTPAQEDPSNPGTYLPIPGAEPARDDDPSHYIGIAPAIDIEKATNGVQSDEAPGEVILEGDAVEWTYVVTNEGTTTLVDVAVTDSQGVVVDCGDGTNTISVLPVGDTVTCTGQGVAGATPYGNVGSVVGSPAYEDPDTPGEWLAIPGAEPVADEDASHYDGAAPVFDLALRKTLVESTSGGPIYTFAIEVINQGNVSATNVKVTDYLPDGMTLDDAAWTDNGDGTASIVVPGPIAPGDTTVIEIDTRVTGFGEFQNLAGIDEASPVHPDTGEAMDVDDIDSELGDTEQDPLTDDVVDGTDGDEDDSDIARIQRNAPTGGAIPTSSSPTSGGGGVPGPAAPQATPDLPTGPLALTGTETSRLALLGLLLVSGGAMLVLGARRRSELRD